MRSSTPLSSKFDISESQSIHPRGANDARREAIRDALEHAAHYIPSQGPITVFIHHNTLHAFEDEPFEQAVVHGSNVYHCQPFLSEAAYRAELAKGRIRTDDLVAALLDDLGDESDQLVACFGTRHALRMAMLQTAIHKGSDAELHWSMVEFDALDRFCEGTDPRVVRAMIEQTRSSWRSARREVAGETSELWKDSDPEGSTLRILWSVCKKGIRQSQAAVESARQEPVSVRHSDILLAATGESADRLVHELLIPFCAAFLDQGLATWQLPNRERGFLPSFAQLFSHPGLGRPAWARGLAKELSELLEQNVDPLELIADLLDRFGVADDEIGLFLRQTLLALPGWSGMVWQLEFNAPWLPHSAPPGSFQQYVAVRLLLDHLAVAFTGQRAFGTTNLREIRQTAEWRIRRSSQTPSWAQRAYVVFQLAQVRGWSPSALNDLSVVEWTCLVREIERFSELERRRIFHLAYERRYRHQALDAIQLHWERRRGSERAEMKSPAFQVVTCIDEREESFRRHLEEYDPDSQTFGMAGFFGVAMYYRGVADGHYKPLCPVNIKPRHYVMEEPAYSLAEHSRRQAEQRRKLGQASHQLHIGTRSLLAGWLAGLFGSLAAIPLIARILFPRTTARIRSWFGSIVHPAVTYLHLERVSDEPGDSHESLGYSVAEMSKIVGSGLRTIGLTKQLADLVIFCGHGSSSLNNPHEAAHDCGACGGGRGGPNARAFAQMANDPRVRRELARQGLSVDDQVVFVGAYHNTCDDSITWYDLDRIPADHRALFERARDAMDEARRRNAHERCRRFESADHCLTADQALHHVEVRAEDLSQVRPEYGHATNSICIVGRRNWTRSLFLDRRAFLTSYDPTQDDERSSILEGLLQAVIPVCSGINLEYYFSVVDPVGFGCGTKLPHNITSLLGVMDGAQSDLRTGLPWQMVEIHEPVRLLFVIDSTPAAMQRIIQDNPHIKRLVLGRWIQLALFDANTASIQVYCNGEFRSYRRETSDLPEVANSQDWYRGQRQHLGFASIRVHPPDALLTEPGGQR